MSPFMAIIVLGILLGTVVCGSAALLKKRGCALVTLPFPLLIILWLILAMIPPDSEKEFERLFGAESKHLVSDIKVRKPLFMDGCLISFRATEEDYDRITAGRFSFQHRGGLSFFGRGRRPSSWPEELETMDYFNRRDFGEDYMLSHFDKETQTAYAAFHYCGW